MRSTEAPFSYVGTSNIASASRGASTWNSIGRVEWSPSTESAAAGETPKVVQRRPSGLRARNAKGCPAPPLGLPGVDREDLHERGERLVEPDAVPPGHGDEVAEPHVGVLVGDHVGDALEFAVRG